LVLAGFVSLGGVAAQAASSGADNAGNYTAGTLTNGANRGTGFGAWQISLGAGAQADLQDSTSGSGNINSTNGLSFMFYGGVGGTYVDAVRDFNAPLAVGDQIAFTFACNYDGGARGVNIQNSSGNDLLNINLGGGNTLSYTFTGSGSVTLSTAYNSTAVVQVVVKQVAGNQLDLTLTRNDGVTTNAVSTGLSSAGAKVKFYNGGHSGDNLNFALFVNDLILTENPTPTLTLTGQDAMAAGMTNTVTLTRGGSTASPVTVILGSSDAAVATVPASVALDTGFATTNFLLTGVGYGTASITATATAYSASSLSVKVYDVGYDDTSYGWTSGNFTNGANAGLGFQGWILQDNAGVGEGFTNYAGKFLGSSTQYGAGNVNSSSGDAFGIYANKDGSGGDAPYFNAIRPFNNALAIGQAMSVEMGINYRNGAKGLNIQNSGTWLFEVAAVGDQYVYQNHAAGTPPATNVWPYAADTAIAVELKRVSTSLYDISMVRRGSSPQTNLLTSVDLGATPPNEVRFYVYNTQSAPENNLYFNRLALWSLPVTDGIPNSWWDRYGITGGDRLAANNPDSDVSSNLEEYIADTDPTSAASVYSNRVTAATGTGIMGLTVGPTTNSRVYDIWWNANLMEQPQQWTRLGLNAQGAAGGGNLVLQVTNEASYRFYRTGVALP
jgi:hypothetical protein